MRRRLLATTMGLGLIVTAMGFTGIYAVFTDRATTGTNSAESAPQAKIADLKIATTITQDCTDGTYTDDLVSGIIAATDLQPGGGTGFTVMCLRNAGSAALDITMSAIDVVDTETDCTGDEVAAGDTTCGTGESQGELAPTLIVVASRLDCVTSATDLAIGPSLSAMAASPQAFGSLGPGETACVWVRIQMAAAGQTGTTLESIQQAQTDKVEWRFAFDGTQA
ncbi:MAG: hypothetical protein ABI620_08545 [Chloroflexota bacterium]